MSAITAGLAERGHKITLLCDGDIFRSFLPPGVPTIHPCKVDQFQFFALPAHASAEPGSVGDPVVSWADACASDATEAVRPLQPEILISSLHCMHLADHLSRELNIPWVFINPSFYFGDDALHPWETDFASPRAVRVFRDRFLPVSRRATAVLHATDPQYDPPPATLPEHHRYIGPLPWEGPQVDLPLLDEPGPPWILVTLSTAPQQEEIRLARAAVDALADRPFRVLLTLPAGQQRDELGLLPSNVRPTGFVPHGPVLERAKLVISQAGHGLVMKALYHGVPMVLVPWDRDQPGVAARAMALGVAVVVPRSACDGPHMAAAIEHALDAPELAHSAKRHSIRLRANDAIELACNCVMRVRSIICS
ncbi:MAG TPA: nucleotide disphospho-sugar-binding domain-containing protein [Acetobacteraceae bacterium]|nr:nucleotide disphospho-sugar-binding domain-containing protein [Acetobacteraceae bacterium]